MSDRRPSDAISRRHFIIGTCGALYGSSFLGCQSTGLSGLTARPGRPIKPAGPGASCRPKVRVAFVRRKESYGMLWPGEIYDGQAALANYRRQIQTTAADMGIELTLRPEPIHSEAEADTWIADAKAAQPDGLLVVLLDRQQHAWPTAHKAVGSKIPTVIFAPVGTAFTTNTWSLAKRQGHFICSTDDFNEVAAGLKMIRAGTRLRETRYLVIRDDQRREERLDPFGTRLRFIPAADFIDQYRRTPTDDEIQAMADHYLRHATGVSGTTRQDVINGAKSYVVARALLEREEADAITMACLRCLGKTDISLPCLAWSRMNDDGIPAACEADLGACVTHALVQYLFDRPGFQQDPVPETAQNLLIGAHCTCPTKLNGFDQKAEPFYLSHHHGARDAVPRTVWQPGQSVTVVDVLLKDKNLDRPRMYISTGRVADNVSVPPSGGCVVSVSLKLDGVNDVLRYPGFHQLFVYGDHRKRLREYCNLFHIEPVVV